MPAHIVSKKKKKRKVVNKILMIISQIYQINETIWGTNNGNPVNAVQETMVHIYKIQNDGIILKNWSWMDKDKFSEK